MAERRVPCRASQSNVGDGDKRPKRNAMPEAIADLRRLLADAADAVEVALDAFQEAPRWCGVPKSDVPNCETMYHYPLMDFAQLLPDDSELIKKDHDRHTRWRSIIDPKDAETGHRWHIEAIWCMVRGLRGDHLFTDKHVTDRKSIDLLRGRLRYQERLDQDSWITTQFALLRPVPDGKPREDYGAKAVVGQPLPRTQDYQYRAIPTDELRAIVPPKQLEAIKNASSALKAAFDRCAVELLMTMKPSEQDLKFIRHVQSVGGSITRQETQKWLEAKGYNADASGPNDPMVNQLRKFCDKLGKSGSRAAWQLRPEALELLKEDRR